MPWDKRVLLLDPVRPSAAIQERFHKELLKRVLFLEGKAEALFSSYKEYLAAYKEAAAQADRAGVMSLKDSRSRGNATVDKSVRDINSLLRKTWKEYSRRFPERGDNSLAREFVRRCYDEVRRRNEINFRRAAESLTVKVQMTERKKVIISAAAQEASVLIKNLGTRAQEDIAGAVNRCLMEGRNLGELTEAVQSILRSTRRRAVNIASDQVHKVESALDRQVKLDLGLNKAIWRHSHAWVKTKWRASHVAADGTEFDLRRGCKIDGEYIFPAQLPYCRCYAQSILTLPEGENK